MSAADVRNGDYRLLPGRSLRLDQESSSKANLFFELGAAIGMGKRVVSIVPKGMDPGAPPLDVRLRRYLIRDTPEQTAEELSSTLQAA